MAIIKWLAGALVGLLLMLALAVLLVPMFVDPNDYRDEIGSVVKQQTGRDLELAGDLKISVFPWLGIQTQGLSLSQPEQIGGDMVSVENAQLRLKLMPLLSKQLEIDTIVLDKPTLNLITLADGTSSFTGLTGDEEVSSGSETVSATGSAPAAPSSPQSSAAIEAAEADANPANAVALVVQGVEITDANVLWDDRQAGQKYLVQDFDLSTGNLLGSSLAPVEMSGTVIDAADPTPIALTVTGEAKIDKDTFKVDFENLDAQINQADQNLTLGFTAMQFAQNESVAVQSIRFTANAIITSEETPDQVTPVALDGVIESVNYQLSGNAGQVDVAGMNVNTELEGRKFNLSAPSVAANVESQTARIDQLQLDSGDLDLAITDLAAQQFIDAPSATGNLMLKPFNALALLKDLKIDYQPTNPSALTAVGMSTGFSGSTTDASLKGLTVNLDQSRLSGDLAVSDFENMSAEFALVLDSLNLDDYLPVGDEAADEEPAVEGAEALALPLAALQTINANGTFKASQLISGGLKLEDIDVSVVSQNGMLTVTPNAKLYDGSLAGQFEFSQGEDQAELKVKNEIDLVSLGNMLTDADVTDQLSGFGSLDVDITVTEKDGVQSNQGVIKLLAKNGAVQGIDIKSMLDGALSTYQQFTGGGDDSADTADQEQQSEQSDETRFAELLGTFYLKDYKLTNNDFSMKAPLFRVLGEGEIDVAAQTLNYLVNVAVVGSTDGQGGKGLDELAGITIPIRLSGDLTAPSYSLDLKSLYSSYAKRELDKKKGEFLQEQLGIEGGEKLSTKDILKGALLKSLSKDDDAEQGGDPVPYEQTESGESEPVPYEQEPAEEPKRELTKKERREERKRKLLESIFK